MVNSVWRVTDIGVTSLGKWENTIIIQFLFSEGPRYDSTEIRDKREENMLILWNRTDASLSIKVWKKGMLKA